RKSLLFARNGHGAMSELSPLCAAKRTSADRSGLRFTSKVPDGQITSDFQKSCQAPFAKIFLFSPDPNQFTDSHCPVPTEGRCARHQRGAGCGGRGSARDERGLLAYGEVVWFRRPNRWRQVCDKKRRRRCQKAWSPRRARSKP